MDSFQTLKPESLPLEGRTSMKMGSLVEVGLLEQRPSMAREEMSYSWGLPKINTEGGVMLKPGSVGPFEPGGA